MKLYYLQGACSLADHITLEWIGQPYEALRVERDALRSAHFLAINPNGQVPVLVEDDGWTLTENVAILNYLVDKFPVAELGGSGKRGRAEVNRWLGYLNSDVHPSFKPLFRPARFIADESAHVALQETARARIRSQLQLVDDRLATRNWLAGSRSIADPYLFVLLRWSKALKIDLNGLDHLDTFFGRMSADPAVQAVMNAEGL